ncbi:T9SS type A sorting domain-containing protein [Hymenobacter canadensis]|uniref:T9SS type A sorting domain-containing protein n=1 Tax=Hymenobacter canadensis TaxID=2999067 RepID=A0ABY7LWW6_9BACT|nr:T9SS type A sorting domain-containing protein [Hymenobacter canadensis]WBA43418.1 T9SS type A sorting domain-containing protein [Hymenobacter canadensis]
MKKTQLNQKGFLRAGLGVLGVMLALAGPAHAQEMCLLQPLSWAERLQEAPLVVEARVQATRSLDTGPHIITLNELEVFKVFRGTLPAGALTLLTEGGTVGLRREEVSNAPTLAVGEQAIFLLQPDPTQLGRYRLAAGPQGLIRLDLATATAADPFRRYTSIPGELYPTLQAQTGQAYREIQPNEVLLARLRRVARPAAPPVITSFSPATVTAGTRAVLTITGSGFGATQGTGTVGFSNANNGGTSFVSPLAGEYLSWSDTEIRVRVPAATVGGAGPAGTGRLLITNGTSESSLSGTNLTVDYSLANVEFSGAPAPVALVSRDGAGGYTLTYNQNFAANTAATASFERALITWRNGVGANRKIAAVTTPINSNVANDNVNVVSFDDATELPAGVLGVAYSYFSGCSNGAGGFNWVLAGTDFIFDGERSWQYGPAAPTGGQIDFETVSLHELGHGIQLGHIIRPGAVMHFAIAANTQNRVLNATNDVAGGNAIIDFSLSAPRCGNPSYVRLAAVPLPVTLVSFGAGRVSGGVQLRWQTATEVNSAFFAVETTLDPAGEWQELTRQPAAGNSTTARRYEYLDGRAGAGLRYYRLRQQDEDGTDHFSSVATVAPAAGRELVAYPNPFGAELQVALPAAEAATLRLYDLAGHLVLTQAVPAGQTAVELSAPAVRPGVYVLEWSTAGGPPVRTRVVKQ